jgi:hypothetical protein
MNYYSGINTRSVAETEKLTFNFNMFCDSTSGVAAVGFSGEDKSAAFNLTSGKIFDPNGNYSFSYSDDFNFQLSGQISGEKYDYYINGEPVSFVGTKDDFKIQKFFVNTTGCSITADLNLYAPYYEHKFTFPTKINLGNSVTGKLEGLDLDRKFQLYSGQVVTPTGITLSGFTEGMVNSSDITFNVTQGALQFQNYDVTCDFYTNFGDLKHKFEVKIVPEYEVGSTISVANIYRSDNLLSGGVSPFSSELESYVYWGTGSLTGQKTATQGKSSTETGVWNVLYDTFNAENLTLVQRPREIDIKLNYVTGNTGTYYVITGFDVVSGGTGYINPVTVTIDQASGAHTSITGKAFADVRYQITGIDLITGGSGYTGVPEITFSGNYGITGSHAVALTGGSGIVTGINLLSGGSGYDYPPTIHFSNLGTGVGAFTASGTAYIGSGYLHDCNVIDRGAYLDVQPTVTISGVSGDGAYVVPLLSGYEKSITTFFDLQTGLLTGNGKIVSENIISYTSGSFTSGNTSFNNNEKSYVPFGGTPVIRIVKNNFEDVDYMVGQVVISGELESYNYYNVTGYRVEKDTNATTAASSIITSSSSSSSDSGGGGGGGGGGY